MNSALSALFKYKKKEGIFALLVMGIAILSIIVIIKP